MSDETKADNQETPEKRLPCRGCTASCVNYSVCNGTPWRLSESVAGQNKDAS